MKNTLLLFLLLFTITSIAQPTYPAPKGVYCSCPPTISTVGPGSVDPTVASKTFVKGILVRIGWKDIEPTDNVYNWTLLDNQITAAQSYGKKISLAIGSGPNCPGWLYSLGTQSLSFSVPYSATIAVQWNSTFLNKWTEFVRALGNKYKNDTTIRLVYITNSTANGFEMQLPFNPTPSYTSLGYTDTKVINSWKQVIDTFKVAFPNHYLTNDFHPVNGSNVPADSIYAYAKNKIGNRYGANAWWWTQNNTTYYSAQNSILLNSASNNNFTGVQRAHSGVTDSAQFGAGGMPAALQLAITNGICYWEIWNQDIVSTKFTSLLTNSTTCNSLTGIDEPKATLQKEILLFPNPSINKLQVMLADKTNARFELKIFDNIGNMILYQNELNNSEPISIDISKFSEGIYFLNLIVESKEQFYRKFIISR
ncbi:MAG: T9SS type A sorting domain-containing protein [Bacteroidetes bacterium]|nr:T9SS type A sorting domain-containing protein [Bacteroidota bacterium]